jgi:hypothetical protein
MELKTYFENKNGMGVLSTADDKGTVNSAVYARPHIFDDGTVAFIMRDRLSHHNLTSNPHAAFLFRENGPGYKGVRLHLTKTREEQDTPLVKDVCRRCRIDTDKDAVRHLVFFKIDKQLPLIGAEDARD